MSNTSMFDTLLELPLLKGASRERIAEIVGAVKFHFVKFKAGDIIFSQGELCTHLRFVLSGEVRVTFETDNLSISLGQTLTGPDVIAPEYLFGRETHYPSAAVALSDVSLIQIEKSDYLKILSMDKVFLLNYLNYLSMNAQKSASAIRMCEGDLRKRIAYVLLAQSQPTGKDVELRSQRKPLNVIFDCSTSDMKQALDSMHDSGLIEFSENSIRIKYRRGLLEFFVS